MPNDTKSHFLWFLGLINYKQEKIENVRSCIWLAVIWVIWLKRNSKIFKDENCSCTLLLNLIKIKAWLWIKEGCEVKNLPFSEWEAEPMLFILNYVKS